MSTYEMRVTQPPKAPALFGGVARVASLLRDVLDAFSEAQRQACEAERRYPFTSC
jgi:hypothetical protein